jgi:hypothetical protein
MGEGPEVEVKIETGGEGKGKGKGKPGAPSDEFFAKRMR